jgi:hypothetical protein
MDLLRSTDTDSKLDFQDGPQHAREQFGSSPLQNIRFSNAFHACPLACSSALKPPTAEKYVDSI